MDETTCSVGKCDRRAEKRGMCEKHYQRWRKHGTTDLPPALTPEQAFWAKVNKTATCWLWTGGTTSSIPGYEYGDFSYRRRNGGLRVRAHRFSYELLVGPIPDGLVLDHMCGNTLCVNPAHLEAKTNAENVRRGSVKDVCKRGHARTPENLYWYRGYGRCKECARQDVAERKARLKREGRWDAKRGGIARE